MVKIPRRILVGLILLGLQISLVPALAKDLSEDELIAELASPRDRNVVSALQELEKKYPTSTKSFPTVKKLLTDSRPKVRRKAARVLGTLHAEVDEENIKAICALLTSTDPDEVTDGLKALRGLKAPSAVPLVTPLLTNANTHLVRDACRTLAAIANRDVIPTIEPLLKHSEPAVQKDAQDAIATLRDKG